MTSLNTEAFGQLLRRKRDALGLTQSEFGDLVGMTISQISEYENGKSNSIQARTIKKFTDALKLKAEEIDRCWSTNPLERHEPFSSRLDRHLYHYPDGKVNAIRLWGSESLNVTEDNLEVRYMHVQISPPVHNREGYNSYINTKLNDATSQRFDFFNGPCTRLHDWRPITRNGAQEIPILHLDLAPVGWYEYSFLNGKDRERRLKGVSKEYYSAIDIDGLIETGSVVGSKLSNILDTATTIVTLDGFVGYALRSRGVSEVPGRPTSSVAENINRYYDECEEGSRAQLVDSRRLLDIAFRRRGPDDNYKPRGVPNPFAAVRRGLDFEIARGLSTFLNPDSMRLTGLSFDLEGGHPDALFIAVISMTRRELEEYRKKYPGRESHEIVLKFAPASFDDMETANVLSRPDWVAGGKASFFRAIEFMHSISADKGFSFSDAVAKLQDRIT